MLAIKLKKIGKKHQPSFRVIVSEKRSKVGGRYVEDLGWLDPKSKEFNVKKERATYWLENGAQPTDTVHNLLVSSGVINAPKRPVHSVKKKKKKAPEAEAGGEVKAEEQTEAKAGQPEEKAEVKEQEKAEVKEEKPEEKVKEKSEVKQEEKEEVKEKPEVSDEKPKEEDKKPEEKSEEKTEVSEDSKVEKES